MSWYLCGLNWICCCSLETLHFLPWCCKISSTFHLIIGVNVAGLILLPVRVSQRWECQGRRIPAHPPQAGREQIWGVWLHGLSRTHSLRSNPRPIFPTEIIQIIRLMALRRVGWYPEHCKGIIDAPPGLEYGSWRTKFWWRFGSTSLGRILENPCLVGWTRTIPIQAIKDLFTALQCPGHPVLTNSGSGICTNSTKRSRAWRNL